MLLYIKETIPAYELQLQEEADYNEAIWCKLVTGHTTVTIGVVYRCPNITKQNNEKIHNAISEVSKGDCIIMGDFNHGNINWDTLRLLKTSAGIILSRISDHLPYFVSLDYVNIKLKKMSPNLFKLNNKMRPTSTILKQNYPAQIY